MDNSLRRRGGNTLKVPESNLQSHGSGRVPRQPSTGNFPSQARRSLGDNSRSFNAKSRESLVAANKSTSRPPSPSSSPAPDAAGVRKEALRAKLQHVQDRILREKQRVAEHKQHIQQQEQRRAELAELLQKETKRDEKEIAEATEKLAGLRSTVTAMTDAIDRRVADEGQLDSRLEEAEARLQSQRWAMVENFVPNTGLAQVLDPQDAKEYDEMDAKSREEKEAQKNAEALRSAQLKVLEERAAQHRDRSDREAALSADNWASSGAPWWLPRLSDFQPTKRRDSILVPETSSAPVVPSASLLAREGSVLKNSESKDTPTVALPFPVATLSQSDIRESYMLIMSHLNKHDILKDCLDPVQPSRSASVAPSSATQSPRGDHQAPVPELRVSVGPTSVLALSAQHHGSGSYHHSGDFSMPTSPLVSQTSQLNNSGIVLSDTSGTSPLSNNIPIQEMFPMQPTLEDHVRRFNAILIEECIAEDEKRVHAQPTFDSMADDDGYMPHPANV